MRVMSTLPPQAPMDAPGGAEGEALGMAQHRKDMSFGTFAHAMLETYH